MRYSMSIIFISILAMSGCTKIISDQSLNLVNIDAPFKSIKESPENYIGKVTLLGGRIANISNSAEGARLEIVQFDLNSKSYPEETFISYGRFLATSINYMDGLIFKPGMLITIVGEIKGKKTLKLEQMDYTYPVIAMTEWYLWPHSGQDTACSYPPEPQRYNPYDYGLGMEPFLNRPYNPTTR